MSTTTCQIVCSRQCEKPVHEEAVQCLQPHVKLFVVDSVRNLCMRKLSSVYNHNDKTKPQVVVVTAQS